MIIILPETQANILEIEVGGRLTQSDYTTTFLPRLKHLLATFPKARILVVFAPSYEGMDMAAVWEDTRFAMAHPRDFEKIAVVGAPGWMKWATNLGAGLTDTEVNFYEPWQLNPAMDWIKTPLQDSTGDTIMKEKSSCVAIYNTHTEAENAVRALQKSGFNMKHLSILGKDYHTEEDVTGYYSLGDRMKSWGKLGAFWGGLWGFMLGSAFFVIPGIGPLVVGGPMVSWIVGALEGAALTGGISALGAGLLSIGIPGDSIIKYETAIKADKFMVVAHGPADEVEKAQALLKETDVHEISTHMEEAAQMMGL